jgi:hypothetical protein
MGDDATTATAAKTIQTIEDYRATLIRCYDALAAIATLPLDELTALQEQADALGPILSPTVWLERRQMLDEDRQVVQALQAAWQRVPAEIQGGLRGIGMRRQATDGLRTEADQ